MFIHRSVVLIGGKEEYKTVFLSGESSVTEDMATLLEDEGYEREVTKEDTENNVTHVVLFKFGSI